MQPVPAAQLTWSGVAVFASGTATLLAVLRSPAGHLLLSATDLTNHLACEHLTAELRRVAVGERPRPFAAPDAHAELVRQRGDRHEQQQLERLISEAGGDWVNLTLPSGSSGDPAALEAASIRTREAMQSGVRLIYQATLLSGRWQGRTDFLRRIDTPSELGPFSYEVVDTKLSRAVKPHVVHQLCLYTRLVGEAQGRELDHAVVILGDGTSERVEVAKYRALHRRTCARLERFVDEGRGGTYPEPTGHCAICRLAGECSARRRADDHLSLVAGARRDQRKKLVAAQIPTLAALADASGEVRVHELAPERFELLHHQAVLQRNARQGEEPTRRHLMPQAERGYARLPVSTPGDIYFDLEGDPYLTHDGGIEYLWGWSTADGYDCLWAHDEAEERAALQGFVEAVEARRRRYPELRVFHYAPHEASKLRSLSIKYATCESAIDDWLRSGLLVDLFQVVRQALQVGEESYSLKHLERHHGFVRKQKSVREGGGSIVAYETWLSSGDPGYLDAIREYNREDCESTASLHHWLADVMRPEAAALFDVEFDSLSGVPEAPYDPPGWLAEIEELVARLHDGLPGEPASDSPDEAERRLLGHLLLYHYRESKPQYWSWFALKAKTPEELVDERDAVGLLELDPSVEPVPVKRSLDWTLRFPAQEVKLDGDSAVDPITGDSFTLVSVADDHLVLRRGKDREAPEPRALIPAAPPDPAPLRKAIRVVAESVLDGEDRFGGIRAVLRREPPRLGGATLASDIPSLTDAALSLDTSYLAVQGPPGTGKTYAGARMVVAALAEGRRVALTANSHAAIQNLLVSVEEHAAQVGVPISGVYKGDGYESPTGCVEVVDDNKKTYGSNFNLVAGTPWLMACVDHEQAFDLLFIDEAGQLALASAVAAGRCAQSIVLLGDPQQLPQVNQASHPDGSGVSVLAHLIEDRDVIADDRGVLLDQSWRMHPDICGFVSERSYSGALTWHPGCAAQAIHSGNRLSGAGLRFVEVDHDGRSQDSPEEAQVIADLCRELLSDGAVTTRDAGDRPLRPEDLLVVAPYNLAVTRIRRHVPEGVRVGTVDRFQGQEAPIVFFAMTCSTDEDVPRGLDFLFDRNRLNVAISRAQCLAVLVHSPRLLDANCRRLELMALVDGACRFVELAQPVPASA